MILIRDHGEDSDNVRWIILAMTSSGMATAIGNGYGQPFSREDQAERRRDALDREYPMQDFLVLPIKISRKET